MLRDALDNPDGFDAAIAWLMERDDVQSLIYLLGVCDIPVRGLVRPSYVRIRDPFEGIPDPGPRLRGACADLREALSGFVWRHCRRLWRHLEQPTPEGAASFVHIARTVLRAIGYALRYEFGLVHGRREMSPEDWGALRDSATMFVEDLEGLLKMVAEYRWAAGAIGVPALSELLEELPAMRHQLLDETWQHVSSIRAACRVRAENGSLIQPAFFPRDTFSDENWRRLCKSCDTAIAAAMRGPLDDVNDG
jgi:hypothetical protein